MRRVVRVFLGFLAVLGVAEGGFRFAGLLFAHDPADALVPAAEQIVVLFVGDSHTWGMGHGYPDALAVRLAARSPRYRVVNLGVPGSNTAQLRKRFLAHLDRFRPRVVVLWSGVNNSWNRTDTDVWASEAVPPWSRRLVEWSRLWRFALAWRHYARLRTVLAAGDTLVAPAMRRETTDPTQTYRRDVLGDEDLQHHEAGELLPDAEVERVTAGDVGWIADQARARGVPLVAVTYPVPGGAFIPTSRGIRSAAAARDVPVIDPAIAQERLIVRYGGREHLPPTFDASVHPTQLLYDETGAMILEEIDRRGWLSDTADSRQ